MSDDYVTIVKFDWEAVLDTDGSLLHTEYIIELGVMMAAFAVDTPREALSPASASSECRAAWTVRRRYTDFYECHWALIDAERHQKLPELPPKESIFSKLLASFADRRRFQRERKIGLLNYCQELLRSPVCSTHACVQDLLALRPAQRLTMSPEPPATFRVRPSRSDTGESNGGLEVCVQQANMEMLEQEDCTVIVPVSEILVIFKDEATDSPSSSSHPLERSGEVAARVRIKVDDVLSAVRAFVPLVPGHTYTIEASAVSVMGLYSAPLILAARVPEMGTNVGPFQPDEFVSIDEDGSWIVVRHERAAPLRHGRQTFTRESYSGNVAIEYSTVVAQKTREIFQRAPCFLKKTETGELHHVTAEVEAPTPTAEEAVEVGTHHREVKDLDKERRRLQRELKKDEARTAAIWIADMTDNEDMRKAAEVWDKKALRQLFTRGEILCKLANAVAKASGGDDVAVPCYAQNPANKFQCIDNMSQFVKACREFFSIPDHQLFDPRDLYEGGDLWIVVRCIRALGGRVQVMYPDFTGPTLGLRDLTDARRRQSKLQAAQAPAKAQAQAQAQAQP